MTDCPFDASNRANSLEYFAIACTNHKELHIIPLPLKAKHALCKELQIRLQKYFLGQQALPEEKYI